MTHCGAHESGEGIGVGEVGAMGGAHDLHKF